MDPTRTPADAYEDFLRIVAELKQFRVVAPSHVARLETVIKGLHLAIKGKRFGDAV